MGGAFAIGMETAHPVRELSFLGGNGPCPPQVHKTHMSDPPPPKVECSLFSVSPLPMGTDVSLECRDPSRRVTWVQLTLVALL